MIGEIIMKLYFILSTILFVIGVSACGGLLAIAICSEFVKKENESENITKRD